MRIKGLLVAVVVLVAACSREQATQTAANTKQGAKSVAKKVGDALAISAPYSGKRDDPRAREAQRFDQRWRELQSFRVQQQQQAAQKAAAEQAAAVAPPAGFRFVTGQKETLNKLDVNAINGAPVNVPITGDVKGPSVLRAQVYLDRVHFSVGSLDGRWGRNSAIAVWWYQRARSLPETGDLDQKTFDALAREAQYAPVVKEYTITADDMKGPFVHIPEDVYEKETLKCLCYESLREKLSEQFHSTEDFLSLLNPNVKFADLQAGTTIVVPNIREPMESDQKDFAKVVVSLAGNSFNGFDANGRLIFHAPTTVGNEYDPSPDETVKVVKITPDPYFHYDPTLYHEVPDSNADANLAPGPNSPVGVCWISLSKPHYGIHGNEDPDSIGYASSHGCIRLTNWDAREVEHRISVGTPVSFVDTRSAGMPEVAKKKE